MLCCVRWSWLTSKSEHSASESKRTILCTCQSLSLFFLQISKDAVVIYQLYTSIAWQELVSEARNYKN